MARAKYKIWLEEDNLTLLRGWARKGYTDEEIAEKMDIAPRTLYRWKNEYSQICQALKKGKDVYDDEVEEALHRCATGYYKDGQYYPPNVTALIFWLKNRRPEFWRDKQEITTEQNVKVEQNPFSDLSTDELRKITGLE